MLEKILIIGSGIVGACFAYHARLQGIKKITIVANALSGEKSLATSNSWGWVNGYASNDKSYAAFRLASLQYWPEFIKNINKSFYLKQNTKIHKINILFKKQ